MPILLARAWPHDSDEVVERLSRALARLGTRVADSRRHVSRARDLAGKIREGLTRLTDDPVDRLVRANAALRATVNSLRSLDDLDAFLADVLKRMVEQVGAASGALFVADREQHLHLRWVLENGHMTRGAESSHPNASTPLPFTEYQSRLKSSGFRRGMPHFTPSRAVAADERSHGYLLSLGVKAVAAIPVMLDDAFVATFHLRLHGDRRPCAEDLQIAQALAEQTALAFRLTRLASEARAAAVAQQAEQAARLRAESAARLARTSRRTLERLAASADPDTFLGHVLTAAAEQLGAVGGSVWRVDDDERTHLIVSLEDGVIHGPADSQLPSVVQEGSYFQQMVARGRELAIDDPRDFATRPEYWRFRDFLALQGIQSLLRVPLFLGDEYRGCLLLRFATLRRLRPEEAELAAAFGNQAVLAIELTRLTASARVAAVSGERSRLARDFHDTLAQGLAGIILHLETAASMCPSARTRPHIMAAAELARESLVEARRAIRALRPVGLDGRTLEDALKEVTDRLARLSAATFRIRTQGAPLRLPAETEAALLRIASEAATNAAKHAQARSVDVELAYDPSAMRVAVRDDGIGFDLSTVTRRNVGLTGMRERAEAIGAALTIASEPQGGTEVLVCWAPPATKEQTV
jgi:signal transduction histidine kinase